jgi:hypothetical protein
MIADLAPLTIAVRGPDSHLMSGSMRAPGKELEKSVDDDPAMTSSDGTSVKTKRREGSLAKMIG